MGGRGAIARRLLPSLLLLACLLVVAALWAGGAHEAYFGLLHALGVPAFQVPFLDTHGVLAVADCHRRGIDVYVTNPCDVMGRVHVYTPLWFLLAATPVTADGTPVVACALALAFAASLTLLPPGRDGRAAWLIGAAALSPAVAFAIERGNADLLMFVLAALAAWIAPARLPTRLLAFPVVVLAAALKIYPATLLILALRERLVLCLSIAVLALAALVAYAAIDAAGLREMLAVVPGGTPFVYSFGAGNLGTGLGVAFGWPPAVLGVMQAILLLATAVSTATRLPMLRPAVRVLTPAEAVSLLVGAALILGCFVMGQSGEYRAVHLLFVLPALTALAAAPGPVCHVARRAAWVILLQLWGDVVSAKLHPLAAAGGDALESSFALVLWVVRELAWWWIIAMLLALLLAIVLDLPSFAALRGRQAARP